MKKKNLNVLIIMIMLLGCILTGCTDRPPKEEGDKQALQMLEELYDDEFTLVSSGPGYDSDLFGKGGTTKLILESENYPNKEIELRYRYNTTDNEYEYVSCNYNFVRYEEDILDILDYLDVIYGDYKYVLKTKLDKVTDYSFKEYIKSDNNIFLYVFLPPTANKITKELDFEKVRSLLERNELWISNINVIYTNEREVYDNIDITDEEDLYGYVRLNGCVEGMLFIDEDFNLKEKSKWIERKKLKKAE
ncbi:MAG: hypothetical protein J6A17_00860 [Bacilli bacterium]|nr:hypothetical protein [Bacilli bacterium]MBO5414155.1 hypothetical protein [Bacilli bacterium]